MLTTVPLLGVVSATYSLLSSGKVALQPLPSGFVVSSRAGESHGDTIAAGSMEVLIGHGSVVTTAGV